MLALLPLLAGFASAATQIDILGLQAHFNQSGLSTVFTDFHPVAILEGGFLSTPGALVAQADTSEQPTLAVDAVDGAAFEAPGYTVMLVDANTVGTPQEGNPQNLHWLANGAQVVDGTLSLDSATVIRAYAGPGPAEGSGSHRYVFVLYAQGDNFTAPVGFTETINEVPSFSLASYVSAAGFESPVAANYFNVQNGEATASVELTQPVNSATLSATATASASASAITAAPSASGSAGSSAGASASGSHAHSSSTSASSSNAPASAKTDSAATNVLPALGLALAAAAASIFAF